VKGHYAKYISISVVLVLVQATVVKLISIELITPDVLAVWVVYLALQQGQLTGTLWGFAIGLSFDMVSGDFIGLSALSKTVCGFIAGYFFNENKTQIVLGSYRFILIVIVASFIQNVAYFIVFTRGTEISLLEAIFRFGLTTSLYTAVAALIPMFRFSRRTVIEYE
jgi:rod shape-determining protein MreD